MAQLDAAFVEQILDIPKREGEPNVQHDCQADDLAARFEIAKWGAICHLGKLQNRPARLRSTLLLQSPPKVSA
jgi:hypothetical protein